MADSLTIKRSITVRAVVTPRWKEDAERELSNAIANSDAQLAQLEASPLVERAPISTARPPFLELSIGRWKALEQYWSA